MKAMAFLDLASTLLQQNECEASLRTSVGRSYFALHNFLATFCDDNGLPLPKNAEKHGQIVRWLQNCGVSEVLEISRRLGTLRANRNDADYDMRTSKFNSQQLAELNYKMAKMAYDEFKSFADESRNRDKLRDAIMQYEAKLKPPKRQ